MKLWAKIIIAIICGGITGLILGPQAQVFQPVGTIFIRLLTMLIVPLIFTSMILGITSAPDVKNLGRIGALTLALYAVTTIIAIAFGIAISSWLSLGSALSFEATETVSKAASLPSLSELLISMVPTNPIQSFANANVIQIIVFSVFFGIALKLVGNSAKPILSFFESLGEVMQKLTSIVMYISPFGVFAIIASTTGSFGIDVILPLLKFVFSYYVACLIFAGVVFGGMLFFMAKLNPIPFFKGILDAVATAVSTCSSSGTLPVNMKCAIDNLGVSKNLANFVLPLGATLNMNGSALFQAMGTLFLAQAYGIELHWQHIMLLFTTIMMATLGTASVPGSGVLMLSVVLSTVGIPIEGIAILASIDRLRDMATTTINISGDTACAVYVAKREGELNENIYYNRIEAVATNEAK